MRRRETKWHRSPVSRDDENRGARCGRRVGIGEGVCRGDERGVRATHHEIEPGLDPAARHQRLKASSPESEGRERPKRKTESAWKAAQMKTGRFLGEIPSTARFIFAISFFQLAFASKKLQKRT